MKEKIVLFESAINDTKNLMRIWPIKHRKQKLLPEGCFPGDIHQYVIR